MSDDSRDNEANRVIMCRYVIRLLQIDPCVNGQFGHLQFDIFCHRIVIISCSESEEYYLMRIKLY